MTSSIALTDLPFSHKAPGAEEMSCYDSATIDAGTPSIELMERAGRAIFEAIEKKYLLSGSAQGEIVILCGPGNNGGDGLVVARHLIATGRAPIIISADSQRYSSDHLNQAKKVIEAGGDILVAGGRGAYGLKDGVHSISEGELQRMLSRAWLIIDAIFGTGQRNAPRGASAMLLDSVLQHAQQAIKIAVDIPSGIDATNGQVFLPHFKADHSITVELVKRGMLQYPGRSICGEITAVSAGIDCSGECEFSIFNSDEFAGSLARDANSHKGRYGRVLVIGGSENFQGAPILTASAAARSGAGLVTLAAMPGQKTVAVPPEIMHVPLLASGKFFRRSNLNAVASYIKESDAAALGPGLGRNRATAEFISAIIKKLAAHSLPCVLDADGLNLLAALSGKKKFSLNNFVLTPHPGEAARLLNCSIEQVERDRFSTVREISKRYSCVTVLKGPHSLIYGNGRGIINTSGNPFMASGGSGDVLTGVIASLIGQKFQNFAAAALGCYLHGLAADMVMARRKAAVLASDVIAALPEAFSTLA